MKEEIMVSILCIAYNHERYISKALDSFLKQKTKYKYEIIVHDDASTDATANIIKGYAERYPEIIRPIYQSENQFSKGIRIIYTYMFPKANGKYIAVCEGDDYWISVDKIEKQVEYLELHSDVAGCVHSAIYVEENGKEQGRLFRAYSSERDTTMEDVLPNWLFPYASLMYRKEYLQNGIPFLGNAPFGDIPLFIYLLTKGKVHYMDEAMSAYRVNSVSSLMKKKERMKIKEHWDYIERQIALYMRIDEYTQYKYTEIIQKMIFDCKFLHYCKYCKFDVLISEEYKEAYKKLPLKVKVSYVLGYINPSFRYKVSVVYRKLRGLVSKRAEDNRPIICDKVV